MVEMEQPTTSKQKSYELTELDMKYEHNEVSLIGSN